jgi:hypothetical protein
MAPNRLAIVSRLGRVGLVSAQSCRSGEEELRFTADDPPPMEAFTSPDELVRALEARTADPDRRTELVRP